jgi:hypothetical protein
MKEEYSYVAPPALGSAKRWNEIFSLATKAKENLQFLKQK